MRAAVSVCLVLATGCLSGARENTQHPFTAEGEALRLDLDPGVILRDRLQLSGRTEPQVTDQPFSHRGRKWHVYPFTTEAGARFTAAMTVHDDAHGNLMAGRSGLWLVGPQRADGSWPVAGFQRGNEGGEPSRGARFQNDEYVAHGQSEGFEQWAVLLGPADAESFLPRFPSRMAFVRKLTDDGSTAPEQLARIDVVQEDRGVGDHPQHASPRLHVRGLGCAARQVQPRRQLAVQPGGREALRLGRPRGHRGPANPHEPVAALVPSVPLGSGPSDPAAVLPLGLLHRQGDVLRSGRGAAR